MFIYKAGEFYNLGKAYADGFYGPSMCDAAHAAEAEAGVESLSEWDIAAPLFFTFVCTTVGLITFLTFPCE